MRNVRTILILAFVAIFTILETVPVSAQSPGVRPKRESSQKSRRPVSLRKLKTQLKLTDGQMEKITERRAIFRKKRAEISGKIKVLTVEYESEMEKKDPDQVKVKQIAKKVSDLRGEQVQENINSELEVRKLLTPEQLEKLKTLQSEDGPDQNVKSDSK